MQGCAAVLVEGCVVKGKEGGVALDDCVIPTPQACHSLSPVPCRGPSPICLVQHQPSPRLTCTAKEVSHSWLPL